MLSNSESESLKSAKGSKENLLKQTVDSELSNKPKTDIAERDRSPKNLLRKNHIPSIVISRKTETRARTRPRSKDDYGMGRGRFEDRRNFRGRGGASGPSRKDRDDMAYVSRGRFQEPVNKPKGSYGGFLSPNDSADGGKDYTGIGLPEDSRISSTLRRLAREEDEKKFAILCKSLQDALALADNAAYIRRSLDMILDSLLDLLKNGVTPNCKILAAKSLGHVGYHLEKEFKRYLDWIFNKYNNEGKDCNRTLIMKAVLELAYLDRKNPKLEEYAQQLMTQVRGVMESTDVGEIFIVTAEITLTLTFRYPDTFTDYFHDTIDIIVGWHIDIHQPPEVLRCASKALQRLAPYWGQDVAFTMILLRQFLEDAENYKDELLSSNSEEEGEGSDGGISQKAASVRKITSFIGVYTSVFKGLFQNARLDKMEEVSSAFMIESMSKVMEIVISTLEPDIHNHLITAGNKCATLLLGSLKADALAISDPVHIYIFALIGKSHLLSKVSLSSLFRFIAKVLGLLNETTTEKLVDTLLQPSSVLLASRLTALQNQVLNIYHALLNLKETPRLIQAYRHIICDLEMALVSMKPNCKLFIPLEDNEHSQTVYQEKDVEQIIIFQFRALTHIAISEEPEAVMALKPSIFEILSSAIPEIVAPLEYPSLHYATLSLLRSHCTANDYFIISNGLMSCSSGRLNLSEILGVKTSAGYETSPTTNYLLTVINLLIKYLLEDMDEANKMLVLKWALELLMVGKRYHTMLRETSEVMELVKAVCVAAMDTRHNVQLVAVDSLKRLLYSYHGLWPHSVMKMLIEVTVFFLSSISPQLRQNYHQFMDLLPCLVTIFSIDGTAAEPSCSLRDLMAKQYEEMRSGYSGEMNTFHFRKFMAYLLIGHNEDNLEWMVEMSVRCSPVLDLSYDVGGAVLGSQTALSQWACFQSAKYCVDNKLRTILGKPLETFMAIEGMIRDLAKEALSRSVANKSPVSGTRARLLVQFVEQLEKCIYNAAEGTAVAFPTVSKPVNTFFCTNRASCCEWMTRIRFALLVICLHSGLATSAVRHGYAFLQALIDNGSTQSMEFESTLIQVGRALANMGEEEAVEGLYEWARDKAAAKSALLRPLIHQAATRYEAAADGYKELLQENICFAGEEKQNGETDARGKQCLLSVRAFIADQLTECYLALNNWEDLEAWKEKEPLFLANENGSSSQRFKYIEADYLRALQEFEKGEFAAAKSLADWKCPEREVTDSRPLWDYCNVLSEMNFTLTNVAITLAGQTSTAVQSCCLENISRCKAVAERILQDAVQDAPSELLAKAALIKYVAHSLDQRHNFVDSPIYGCEYKMWKENIKSPVMEQALWWGLAVDGVHRRPHTSPSLNRFTLQVAKVARKIGNYKFAERVLREHLRFLGLRAKNCDKSLLELTCDFMDSWGTGERQWTLDNTNALREITKLLMSVEEKEKGMELCSFIALGLNSKLTVDFRYLGASMLRKLSVWVRAASPSYANPHLDQLLQLEAAREIPSFIADLACCPIVGEGAVGSQEGRLLRLSILTYPSMCKSWERLASWAYSCGLACLSRAGDQLTPEDRTSIQSYLPSGTDPRLVFSILTNSDTSRDPEDIEGDNTSCEIVEQQLRNIGTLKDEQIEKLLKMWGKIHLEVYNYFRLSAYAYFNYIEISEYHEENNRIVTGTLRLLRLIVKHAHELQKVVETGLSSSPTSPWTSIVPQLFSRLNHPEPYVRQRVAELLTRIGLHTPHLIIFPAVVGSHTGASTIKDMPAAKLFKVQTAYNQESEEYTDDEEEEEEEDEEENDEDEDTNDDDVKYSNDRAAFLENSFLGILDTLSKKYGEEISAVKTLVSELRRITLLWDELWLGTLNQHQGDLSRRFLQLQAEVKLTDGNPHLSQQVKDHIVAEKHRLILKPILFVLEQLQAITSVAPETPHELKFQERFGKEIEDVLRRLREPSDPRAPSEVWTSFKTLMARLGAATASRASSSLSMAEISPPLARLKDSVIAMPGLTDPVTIQSILDTVAVLPTKTKPKKLVFRGSNGRQYTYLFKGLEDLHLDERIMQFLSIANSMLRQERLRARHYSVVPLGPRSGLISWVENVTPIFTLYKKFQQREVAASDTCFQQILRPSEVFYKKLDPILKEVGITRTESNRSKWPLSSLKKCLVELMQATPNYLLSRELWCHSVNSADWWQITKLYSSSLAVMSMIGYIIGLGDRHLDNVLVNLKTGEVVHIDYNVCFEKGKTLRVPEKVPFRLTPNLRAALGLTGIQGIYSLTCEHVLRVLKGGQETLLTLLEAFVYDPLIDWTPLNESGYTGAVYGGGRQLASEAKQSRKELEREVTVSMFRVRMLEIQDQWTHNKEDILVELRDLLKMIDLWQSERKEIAKLQESLQERHSQLSVLKEAEGQPQHSLFTLSSRFAKHVQVFSSKQAVQNALRQRILESETQLNNLQTVITALRGPEISLWIAEVNSRPQQDVCQVFDLIKEFLQNAGQSQMVQQCIQSEREVGEICCQQTQLTGSLLEMLRQYWEIFRQYPASSLRNHRSALYKRWSEWLLEDLSKASSVEGCEDGRWSEVRQEMRSLVTPSDETMRTAAMFSAGLHRHYTEARTALGRAIDRLKSTTVLSPAYHQLEAGGRADPAPVQAVVLTALTALNKRFLQMEAAALSAGDCLPGLTSREGDWFLDDMVLVASTALHLLPLIDPPPSVTTAIKCLHASLAQYKALQKVDSKLRWIILVEGMGGMQCEEPSVLEMVDRLETLVTSSGVPLSDLLHQLQLHLRFTIMGMESPHENCVSLVAVLKSAFERLLIPACPDALTQGEMLLMGFDGLFAEVTLGRESLLSNLQSLQSPPAWKTVDQIWEAKSHYTAPICDDKARAVLDDMFFVKRVDTMLEVLRLLRADARGFRAEPGAAPVPHDTEALSKPLRRYIADYISYQLLGVFTLSLATAICLLLEANGLDVTGAVEQKDIGAQSRVPLEELCKKMVEKLGRHSVREASGLVSQSEASWRQAHLRSRLEGELAAAEGHLVRCQLRLTAHHWLHDHYLVSCPSPPSSRGVFMLELKKACSALLALQPKLKDALDQQNSLIASAEQRLKWASGANPALTEVMSAFESCVTGQREKLDKEKWLAVQTATMCGTVLLHEALRTPTQEALLNDNAMLRLAEECEKAALLLKSTPVGLSPTEEGLVTLLPPNNSIDSHWIATAEQKISESIRKLKGELEPLQVRLCGTEDCVKHKASTLRTQMARHHRIIADVKTLLKAMLKYEDAGLAGLPEYLAGYKRYTERLSGLNKTLSSSLPLTSAAMAALLQEVQALITETDAVYSGLLKFTVGDSPLRKSSSPRDSQDRPPQHTHHKGSQERNAYAMSVWRRVKLKLEGRDPDPDVRTSEKQQVEWTINEATNLENLALLYEGWTPWV